MSRFLDNGLLTLSHRLVMAKNENVACCRKCVRALKILQELSVVDSDTLLLVQIFTGFFKNVFEIFELKLLKCPSSYNVEKLHARFHALRVLSPLAGHSSIKIIISHILKMSWNFIPTFLR